LSSKVQAILALVTVICFAALVALQVVELNFLGSP
jgi:hypothetical protein